MKKHQEPLCITITDIQVQRTDIDHETVVRKLIRKYPESLSIVVTDVVAYRGPTKYKFGNKSSK